MNNRRIPNSRLIKEISPSATPTLPRARLLHQIVDAVNKNTLALSPPRQRGFNRASAEQLRASLSGDTVEQREGVDEAEEEIDRLFPDRKTWFEVRRSTSTVRVENPEDSEQYVDVERIDSVTFVSTFGELGTFIFYN